MANMRRPIGIRYRGRDVVRRAASHENALFDAALRAGRQ
jgi:hypothetical protein